MHQDRDRQAIETSPTPAPLNCGARHEDATGVPGTALDHPAPGVLPGHLPYGHLAPERGSSTEYRHQGPHWLRAVPVPSVGNLPAAFDDSADTSRRITAALRRQP